jgi:hypothetical protein
MIGTIGLGVGPEGRGSKDGVTQHVERGPNVILEPVRDSSWVRFSAGREGQQETFTTIQKRNISGATRPTERVGPHFHQFARARRSQPNLGNARETGGSAGRTAVGVGASDGKAATETWISEVAKELGGNRRIAWLVRL